MEVPFSQEKRKGKVSSRYLPGRSKTEGLTKGFHKKKNSPAISPLPELFNYGDTLLYHEINFAGCVHKIEKKIEYITCNKGKY